MKKILTSILLLSFFNILYAQTPITIVESTVKISTNGEEVFYYGFAAGDQLIFSFEEIKGKELRELEISELPSSSKFIDYKTSKIDKIIEVSRTGIYKFKFTNTAFFNRICKIKIQRIPASDSTKNFNTSVYWRTVVDTSYSIEQERYIIKTDTVFSNLADIYIKAHSRMSFNNRNSYFYFTLPENTLAWAYYISINRRGLLNYESAALKSRQESGMNPLEALIHDKESFLANVTKGENITFQLKDGNLLRRIMPKQSSYLNKRKVKSDFSKMTYPLLKGKYVFYLYNDNLIIPVNVCLKVAILHLSQVWGEKPKKVMHISQREEAYLKN